MKTNIWAFYKLLQEGYIQYGYTVARLEKNIINITKLLDNVTQNNPCTNMSEPNGTVFLHIHLN